ncbi:hypothetical protein [Saccharopolyspora gloriosae]|uniref:hypothetical protein n=1 Tax=Saccharopolyspora gloriosae TaxID=455344 RepID=UPI001FB75F7C|nr:hypothetical protein [Saccharopolyspora gloriosae]
MAAEDTPPQQSAKVTGGTFSGVTVVGQGNEVSTGSVNEGSPELDDLRGLVQELIDELSDEEPADARRAVAHDRAEQLSEELAEPAPEPKRVRKSWERLAPALEVIKLGLDVPRIADLVTRLF